MQMCVRVHMAGDDAETAARDEWQRENGELFPTAAEAAAVLGAAAATVDHPASCGLIQAVLDWACHDGPATPAAASLKQLLQMYQKGSMLHDACQVLSTACRDAMYA